MNTPNNKRRLDSQNRMETAFVRLLQDRELEEITVTEICREAGVNRTTFYANYLDLRDLAEAVQKRLEAEVAGLHPSDNGMLYNSIDFLSLFRHIYENQLFYKTYFKLGGDGRYQQLAYDAELAARHLGGRHIEYHIAFFRSGLNAVIKRWLENGCVESPEEINDIILTEYARK